MDFTLSRADKNDIDPIFRLNKELIDKYEDTAQINYTRVLEIVENDIREHIAEYQRIICGGQTAGYLLALEKNDHTELDDLFLYPNFQNHGIGTEIINKIINNFKKPIFLHAFIKNEGAVRLYKRLGFEIVETVHKTRYKMKYDEVNRQLL